MAQSKLLSRKLLELYLTETFGFEKFKCEQQADLVLAIVNGDQDTFVLAKAGCGKTHAIMFAASLLEQKLLLVVSPLLAIQAGMLADFERHNIPAVCFNSRINPQKVNDSMKALLKDADSATYQPKYKIILICPERLALDSFNTFLLQLANAKRIGMVIVDEAHIMSTDGKLFRPSIRLLYDLRQRMPLHVKFAALTASAPSDVQKDIYSCLRFDPTKTLVIKSDSDRPEILYAVKALKDTDDVCGTILSIIGMINQSRKYANTVGLVFMRRRMDCSLLVEYLRKRQVECDFYHSQCSTEAKNRVLNKWMRGDLSVLVSTTAVALGVSNPHLRWVIHGGLSSSIIDYYQEASRVSRLGQDGLAIMLYSKRDYQSLMYNKVREAQALKRNNDLDYAALQMQWGRDVREYAMAGGCRHVWLCRHLDNIVIPPCKDRCDSCLQGRVFVSAPKVSAVIKVEPSTSEEFTEQQMMEQLAKLELLVATKKNEKHKAKANAFQLLQQPVVLTRSRRLVIQKPSIEIPHGQKLITSFTSNCENSTPIACSVTINANK